MFVWNKKVSQGLNTTIVLLIVTLLCLTSFNRCQANVISTNQSSIAKELSLPITTWQETSGSKRGIVVMIHGLIMHGSTYAVLASKLAKNGFLVVAPDLRGYGHWLSESSLHQETSKVNYKQSQNDVTKLLIKLRADYPGLPLMLVGESLGADVAIRIAASHIAPTDGLVLSSPALKRRSLLSVKLVGQLLHIAIHPHTELDLTPYIKERASEDPTVVCEMLSDPLVRKHLSCRALIATNLYLSKTLKQASNIPRNLPILIIQGNADRLLKSNAVVLLLKKLKSRDQTVRWYPSRGHIILETAYVRSDTLATIEGWLIQHANLYHSYKAAAARTLEAVGSN